MAGQTDCTVDFDSGDSAVMVRLLHCLAPSFGCVLSVLRISAVIRSSSIVCSRPGHWHAHDEVGSPELGLETLNTRAACTKSSVGIRFFSIRFRCTSTVYFSVRMHVA